jgi:hypothetical protein
MPRILFCIFILLALSRSGVEAKTPVVLIKQKAALKTDSSHILVRTFDRNALAAYRKQPEFKYAEVDETPSWWTQFWRAFWNWVSHVFDFLKTKNHQSGFFRTLLTMLEYLAILAGVGALVFIILRIAGVDVMNIFRHKPASANLSYNESEENIHEINFDPEIENAVSQNNFRLAVRLLYLKSLKQLSDANMINWQPEKTNSTYINEINEIEQRQAFKLLTRQFEYVWYGEFQIDAAVFNNISTLFQQFKKRI